MKEKLIIRNFGPIKDVELNLGKITILIGKQATGKSTIAKVLAICKYFSYIIDGDYTNSATSPFAAGLRAWGLEDFSFPGESYISYNCEDYFFEAKCHLGKADEVSSPLAYWKTNMKPGKKIQFLLNELRKLHPKNFEGKTISTRYVDWAPPASFFELDVKNVMDKPFFLPAERGLQSIFSLGKESIQNISDSLFIQFAKMDGIYRSFKNEVDIDPLGIYYKNESGRSFVKSSRHDFISLANAATGYQSIVPIVLAIKYYTQLRNKNKTFIIEEPEQNLFPTTQYELVKFFADNLDKVNGFLITTHSPYILTSINNLMHAFIVGAEIGEKEVSKIIDKSFWINPEDVSAYQLLSNGKSLSLIADDKLIMSEKIDEVSSKINKEYDEILNLQYG